MTLKSTKHINIDTPTPPEPSTDGVKVTKHGIPPAVTIKPVLALIRCYSENDNQGVEKHAVEIAYELELNGEEELAYYIYAQFGLVETFKITD